MYKIAISGKANSGKSTLSKILTEELEKNLNKEIIVKNLAFADPMKAIAQILFPTLPSEYLYGPSYLRNEVIPQNFKNNQPLTVRQFLQDLGTDFARSYNKDTWINIFDHELKSIELKNKINPISSVNLFLCSDCRFINEFNYLKNNNFNLIRLVREQQNDLNHSSETEQEEITDNQFDFVIKNDGTLHDLHYKIQKIIPLLKST